jgi:glycosyltransferase involved in cell wall biosynthesis
MKFLFVANLAPTPDSGAAGSLLAIGAALSSRGNEVEYEWQPKARARVPHATLSTLLELPRHQYEQVVRRLRDTSYDVVIASQPYAYHVYEKLPREYRNTLFLNRTHGWEDRLYRAYHRFNWDGPKSVWRRGASYAVERTIRKACRRTAQACHGLITASSSCAHFVSSTYEVDDFRVLVAPYGVDDALLRQAPVAHAPDADLGVLYVGNYLPRKGARVLEELLPPLASRYQDLRLTFVVDDGSVERIRQHYLPAFGERLTVGGWLRREGLHAIYARHQILLHPSLFEGFGKTWQEAMACGLCVVGFAEGGLPDVATHGQTAVFCEPGDGTELRALLERCLSDRTIVHTIGARARAHVRQYTWDRHAAVTEQFCETLRHGLV